MRMQSKDENVCVFIVRRFAPLQFKPPVTFWQSAGFRGLSVSWISNIQRASARPQLSLYSGNNQLWLLLPWCGLRACLSAGLLPPELAKPIPKPPWITTCPVWLPIPDVGFLPHADSAELLSCPCCASLHSLVF